MSKPKENRHMVSILQSQYEIISNYCKPKNIIIGKWISQVCVDHIIQTLSGSSVINNNI